MGGPVHYFCITWWADLIALFIGYRTSGTPMGGPVHYFRIGISRGGPTHSVAVLIVYRMSGTPMGGPVLYFCIGI